MSRAKLDKKIENYRQEVANEEDNNLLKKEILERKAREEREKMIKKLNEENEYDIEKDEKVDDKNYFKELTITNGNESKLMTKTAKNDDAYQKFKIYQEQIINKYSSSSTNNLLTKKI